MYWDSLDCPGNISARLHRRARGREGRRRMYCAKEKKPCVGWVEKYFRDCLCNLNDDVSFALGLISLVSWGVAEIPQIVTNFRTKSSHGVSIAFLLTWVAGDIFNLVGCLLEPATLPTQLYTALLYTTSTVVLVLQSLYYDHICGLCRSRRGKIDPEDIDDDEKPLEPRSSPPSGIPIPKVPQRPEFYYTSARSLAGSGTPPFRTYARAVRSGPPAIIADSDSSSDEEKRNLSSKDPASQQRRVGKAAGYAAFLAASINYQPAQAYAAVTSRKLLQEQALEHSALGQCLGWIMAAIYMGGRIPQIWLNIKRGSVEGLNPLMFIFALVANVTYVGSIVVRTTERERIRANMPWLLDAAVCVALDLFIILQYVYYRHFRKEDTNAGEDYEDSYVEANKEYVS